MMCLQWADDDHWQPLRHLSLSYLTTSVTCVWDVGEWIYYVCTMMQPLGDNGRIHFFDVEVEAQGPDLARGRQPRVNRQCYFICCVSLNVFIQNQFLIENEKQH